MLAEDPEDVGTFLDLKGDFTEDPADPGTFEIARHRVWIERADGLTRDGFRERGYVVGVDLPLTVNDGPMYVDVGVL